VVASYRSKLLVEFSERGLIHEVSAGLDDRLARDPAISAYIGFDPSADSLHVGHLMGVLALRRLQLSGGRPIALVGGGTGMIGDPSGRSAERNLLDRATLDANRGAIGAQLTRLLDFSGATGALLLDNLEWLGGLGMIDFLRDTGKHLTVSYMLAKDSVKSRLEGGLSFTEFSYMLLQSYDFLMLRKLHGVELQMGGSDQWGNITAGSELIRRVDGSGREGAPLSFGLCFPLLLVPSGEKFGKTAAGAVWLSADRTSPFAFRQFFMDQPDDALEVLLQRLTLDDQEAIRALLDEHAKNPGGRVGQRRLATAVTALVHGESEEMRVRQVAETLFGGPEGRGSDPRALDANGLATLAAELPTAPLPSAAEATLIDLVIAAGFGASKSEARRLVEQGGISVNGDVAADPSALGSSFNRLNDGSLLLCKGRRDYRMLRAG